MQMPRMTHPRHYYAYHIKFFAVLALQVVSLFSLYIFEMRPRKTDPSTITGLIEANLTLLPELVKSVD